MGAIKTPLGDNPQPPQGEGGDNTAPPAAPQAQDDATAQGDTSVGSQDDNVSPDEQKIYDTVLHRAADLIYGDGHVNPEILKSLSAAKNPSPTNGEDSGDPAVNHAAVIALADTATAVVQKLDVSSQQQGFHIPDDILYHAGVEVVEMLAEVATVAKIHDYSDEETTGAFYQAIDNYRPIAERMGRTDPEKLKGQFEEILHADQQGHLGELLPGLKTHGGGAPPPPQDQPADQQQSY
jgi:hypothetical protein